MEPTLIINADDLGYDPEVTRGILEAMREGVVTSATLMVNTPHSAAAAAASAGRAIGLHLNLARFPPCWADFPKALQAAGQLSEPLAPALPPEVVEGEALAQLDRFAALCGRPPTHVDVHKHLHRHPTVLAGLARAARARGLPVRSIDAATRDVLRAEGVATNDHFIGDAGAEPYWTITRLREQLEHLPRSGVTELMCHPGYAPRSLLSGYGAQREVELRTFVSPGARALLARVGAHLGDFSALRLLSRR